MKHLTYNLLMISTRSGRKRAEINATVERHKCIIDSILHAHVLSVCDTVSFLL